MTNYISLNIGNLNVVVAACFRSNIEHLVDFTSNVNFVFSALGS